MRETDLDEHTKYGQCVRIFGVTVSVRNAAVIVSVVMDKMNLKHVVLKTHLALQRDFVAPRNTRTPTHCGTRRNATWSKRKRC